jgi:hypothetical protein
LRPNLRKPREPPTELDDEQLAILRRVYRYLGDGMTDPALRGAICEAVRRPDGKCIRGRNGNMLVHFGDGRLAVVLARHLRKIEEEGPWAR